jgi:tyrosyl-tRNA synthetase
MRKTMNTILNTQTNDAGFPGIWDELLWRGLVKVSTDETQLRTLLNDGNITFYCGFDPTASSLHVGNLVQLLVMRRLQLAGHTPLALVGGSTGLIGDPRPTAERTLNTPETVNNWVGALKAQVSAFLAADGDNGVKVVNNLDWFGQMNALDFLRDLGKHFRVNTMMKKDAVQSRLNSDAGISFTEFSYQILQASDFLELFRTHGCVLQTGGSDQWGNLTAGIDLVGRKEGETVHAIGTPLIMNSDGTKFGKSEGNAVWLDADLTSPFQFFQFWLNTADADVVDRLKVFTFLDRDAVNKLATQLHEAPHARAAQKALAFEVTALVHGVQAAEDAVAATAALFGATDVTELSLNALEAVTAELDSVPVQEGQTILSVLVAAGFTKSISEAQRLVKQNGLSVNGVKVVDGERTVTADDFLFGKFMVVKKGKKQMVVGTPTV